jgi:glycosyltransferase involved in cell wall biosynthesis
VSSPRPESTRPPSRAGLVEQLRQRGATVSHFVGHLTYGDAVSFDAFNKWRLLRELGIPGELYASVRDDHYRRVARSHQAHRPSADELIVFHYSTWSPAAEYVQGLADARVLLVYHNITPTRWFEGVHAGAEEDTRLGRARLPEFVRQTPYAVAMSEYSRAELEEVGFADTGVVPLLIDFAELDEHSRGLRQRLSDGYVNLLSVSRIAPNKCHEDTIKLFYCYKRLVNPRARLVLVGATVGGAYRLWLERLVRRLGLDPHVLFPGHVSNRDRAAYFRSAHAYVCMSEHEGFAAPLLEAMYCRVPVLAFDATAVPYTLGDAGVLLRRKDPVAGAEAVRLLVEETPLRRRMIEKGRERVAEFAPERTRERFVAAVGRALGAG